MAIIDKKVGNTTYVYETIYKSYDKETGRRKYIWKLLGKLDGEGNLIPSKKNRRKALEVTPVEIVIKTTTQKIILRPKK